MFDRRPDTVAPGAFILMTGRGEGRAGQLFAVKPVIALLGAVHALRQRAGQCLALEVIAETRHVAFVFPGDRRGLYHRAGGALFGHVRGLQASPVDMPQYRCNYNDAVVRTGCASSNVPWPLPCART